MEKIQIINKINKYDEELHPILSMTKKLDTNSTIKNIKDKINSLKNDLM
jgi:hypothetical protein